MKTILPSPLTMSTKLPTPIENSVNITVISRNIKTFTLEQLVEFLKVLVTRTQHMRRVIRKIMVTIRKATKCINTNPGNDELKATKKKLDVQMAQKRASLNVLVDSAVRVKSLIREAKADARKIARKAKVDARNARKK